MSIIREKVLNIELRRNGKKFGVRLSGNYRYNKGFDYWTGGWHNFDTYEKAQAYYEWHSRNTNSGYDLVHTIGNF